MSLSDVKKIQRRAKGSERDLARFLMEHDGMDPRYADMASSTGRIGHLTGLQFDVASVIYDAENKNQVVPQTLWKAWKQICSIAAGHGKEPLLRLAPSNADKKGIPVMHIITEERHARLLALEKAHISAEGEIIPPPTETRRSGRPRASGGILEGGKR
jgi:hypothetical protein